MEPVTLTLQSKLNRTWWGRQKAITISATLRKEGGGSLGMALADFFHQLSQEAPQLTSAKSLIEYFSKGQTKLSSEKSFIINLRGRPRETFSAELTGKPGLQEEELLYVDGILALGEELPFSYQLNSHFRSFQKQISTDLNISHETNQLLSGPIQQIHQVVYGMNLMKLVPFQVHNFRVGLEIYGPKYFGLSLGQSVIVLEQLYLSANHREIALYLSQSGLKPSSDTTNDLLKKISKALATSGIYQGFYEKLESRSTKSA